MQISSVHKASLNNLQTSLQRRSSSTYSKIPPIKSPSFCTTTFNAILTNLTTRRRRKNQRMTQVKKFIHF